MQLKQWKASRRRGVFSRSQPSSTSVEIKSSSESVTAALDSPLEASTSLNRSLRQKSEDSAWAYRFVLRSLPPIGGRSHLTMRRGKACRRDYIFPCRPRWAEQRKREDAMVE